MWEQTQQQDASAGVMERERVKRLVEFGILIDEVQKAGQDDVCGSKHNADGNNTMVHENKDPAAIKDTQVMASEEEHQEHKANQAHKKHPQCPLRLIFLPALIYL
jgi:hypothetical protein